MGGKKLPCRKEWVKKALFKRRNVRLLSQILSLARSGKKSKKRPGRPTFVEFVDYLLSTPVTEYNDHWIPYWLHCHACEIEYDVVGKIDTIERDINFITSEYRRLRPRRQSWALSVFFYCFNNEK